MTISNYIGIGKETIFGTPVAPSFYLKINESDGVNINNDIQYVESIVSGVLAKNKEAFKGKIEYEGSFELPFVPQSPTLLMYSALGNLTTQQLETGVYKHTLIESETKPSLTLEQKIGEIVKRFSGFIVKQFTLEGSPGEYLNFSFDGLAKTQVDQTPSTPSYETHRVLNFADISYFKVDTTDIKSYVEDFSIEYTNNLESFYGLGSNELVVSYPTPSEISGSFTLLLNSSTKTIFDNMVGLQNKPIEILINGNTLGSTFYSTKILIPKAVFETAKTSFSTEYDSLEVDFTGVYDEVNGLVKIEVVNSTNSY